MSLMFITTHHSSLITEFGLCYEAARVGFEMRFAQARLRREVNDESEATAVAQERVGISVIDSGGAAFIR
ncbi:MAG: hypothetical protein ACJ74J_13725 [Blastocatellia bacterium]